MGSCRQNGWMDILAAVCALYPTLNNRQSSIYAMAYMRPPPPSFMYTTQTKIQYIYIELLTNINAYLTLLFTKNTPPPFDLPTYLTSPPPGFSQLTFLPPFLPFFHPSSLPFLPSLLPPFLSFFLSLSIHSFIWGLLCQTEYRDQ